MVSTPAGASACTREGAPTSLILPFSISTDARAGDGAAGCPLARRAKSDTASSVEIRSGFTCPPPTSRARPARRETGSVHPSTTPTVSATTIYGTCGWKSSPCHRRHGSGSIREGPSPLPPFGRGVPREPTSDFGCLAQREAGGEGPSRETDPLPAAGICDPGAMDGDPRLDRRSFLKVSGTAAGGLLISGGLARGAARLLREGMPDAAGAGGALRGGGGPRRAAGRGAAGPT